MTEPLPVAEMVREIYGLFVLDWRRIVKFSWPVVLLCVLVAVMSMLRNGDPHETPSYMVVVGRIAVNNLVMLVTMFFFLPLATGVHRMVLIGEGARTDLSFHHEEWGYLRKSLSLGLTGLAVAVGLIILFGVVAGLISAFVTSSGDSLPLLHRLGSVGLFDVALLISLYYVLPRFSMILPAVAIGQTLTFRESEKLVHGHAARLFVILLLTFLPAFLCQFLISALAATNLFGSNGIMIGVAGVLTGLLQFSATVLWSLSLSVTYRHVGGQVPEGAHPAL